MCFQIIKADHDSFSNINTLPPSSLLNPKPIFSQKPNQNSSKSFSKSSLRYVWSLFSLYFLRLIIKFWVLYKLGLFLKKGLKTLSFVKFFFNFLIGLCPICFVYVCVGPLWHFNLYLGKIHTCSCIVYMLVVLLHTNYLIKCQMTFSHCFGLRQVPIFGNHHNYSCLSCFDYWLCVLHTFPRECLLMHWLCISHAH